MKVRPALLLSVLLLAAPALAGNVYRCEGSDGVTTYANKRVAGASCKLVGSYKAQRAPKPRVAARWWKRTCWWESSRTGICYAP